LEQQKTVITPQVAGQYQDGKRTEAVTRRIQRRSAADAMQTESRLRLDQQMSTDRIRIPTTKKGKDAAIEK
jgi:hypothetical protein